MSVHGGVGRQAILIGFEWKKYIDEYNGTLNDTWHLKITLGPLDISIDRIPNRKYFKIYKWCVCGFGYSIDFMRSWETFEKNVFGDASEELLRRK